jgi:DNA-binding NtrC family response regulator
MKVGKILVVDDDTPSRLLLRRALQRRGHEVAAVGTAAEACAAIEAEAEQFAAVVSDLRLPLMDGAALAEWMHTHTPGLGLVVVSADDGPDLARLAQNPVVMGTLSKPIDFDRLHELVQRALAQSAARAMPSDDD